MKVPNIIHTVFIKIQWIKIQFLKFNSSYISGT